MTTPPRQPIDRAGARDLDRRACDELGLPTIVLMENAARGAADVVAKARRRWKRDAVLVACGPGNNGGDGLALARHLHISEVPVTILLLEDPASFRGDALINWTAARGLRIPARRLGKAPSRAIEELAGPRGLIVDALFGTGLSRPVEGVARRTIEAINASGLPVVALDVPSGLDCDSGEVLGCAVRARVTATFVAPKPALSSRSGARHAGRVVVVSIGVPRGWKKPAGARPEQ